MRPMTTWHRLGDKPELLLQVPTVFKLDRWSVAVFHHDGRFRAIGNACNHKGGPLSEGRLHGEFVMCPWHAWEYSVITGKGPEGYDEEQVPVFAVEEREDGVYVQTPPVMPRRLVKHKPSHLLEVHPKPAGASPRVLVISTTAMDDVNPRFSTSDALLEHALEQATRRNADTQYIKLRDLKFRHCEGNYSKAAHACTWPCAITERDPEDQLTAVYEGLVHWAKGGGEQSVRGGGHGPAGRGARLVEDRGPTQGGDDQADGARRPQGELAAGARGDRGDHGMSRRLDLAKMYEKALFAGDRAT